MLRTVPVWSDTLRDRGLVTIFVNSSLGEDQPGFIDRALNTIHVNAALLNDEDALRDAVTAGFTALAPKRPGLTALPGGGTDNTRTVRPALRLVRDDA